MRQLDLVGDGPAIAVQDVESRLRKETVRGGKGGVPLTHQRVSGTNQGKGPSDRAPASQVARELDVLKAMTLRRIVDGRCRHMHMAIYIYPARWAGCCQPAHPSVKRGLHKPRWAARLLVPKMMRRLSSHASPGGTRLRTVSTRCTYGDRGIRPATRSNALWLTFVAPSYDFNFGDF